MASNFRNQGYGPNDVFVVHGRNHQILREFRLFLYVLGLRPLGLEQAVALSCEGAPYIEAVLEVAMEKVRAVVVLLTPDEEVRLLSALAKDRFETLPRFQPRPNVFAEMAMALRSVPQKTVLVKMGEVNLPSDYAGRHYISLDNSPESRWKFIRRLEAVGCPIDLPCDDWFYAGNLTPPHDLRPRTIPSTGYDYRYQRSKVSPGRGPKDSRQSVKRSSRGIGLR